MSGEPFPPPQPTVTHTTIQTQTVYSQPTNAYANAPPPPMYAPPPIYAAPPVTAVPVDFPAGAVMGPGTAIVSILVVAAVYWGLKSGGTLPAFLSGGSAPAAVKAR